MAEEYRRRQMAEYERHAADQLPYGSFANAAQGLANTPDAWSQAMQGAFANSVTAKTIPSKAQQDMFVATDKVKWNKPKPKPVDWAGAIGISFRDFEYNLRSAIRDRIKVTAFHMKMPEPTTETLIKTLNSVVFERRVDSEEWTETIQLTMCFKFPDGDTVVFPRKFDLEGGHAEYNPFGDKDIWDKLLESMQLTETELLQLASAL